MTCTALWDHLAPVYVKCPSTPEEWQKVAHDFGVIWNFPNCLGAIDGKHVVTECPPNSGSMHYNYEGSFSTVLMAICDAHYRFLCVDIGKPGSESDGGAFSRSEMGTRFENQLMNLPPPEPLKHGKQPLPWTRLPEEGL
ncbi:putative nuclease HARBI1 [Ornithodoros turicata]|uniref:putative nuclease HARBI1 n=1 Tax=Ornithodoros turicata TaxID=34597 RepID=UPI0031397F8A